MSKKKKEGAHLFSEPSERKEEGSQNSSKPFEITKKERIIFEKHQKEKKKVHKILLNRLKLKRRSALF